MSSNATTRRTRTAAGQCSVCLRRKATAPHPTCRSCRKATAERSAKRYKAQRKAKRCVRCNEPASGYLCETDALARRVRRAANGTN